MCCRKHGGQWHEEEEEQTAGKPQGEVDAAVDDDTDNQLPVNTLFYGVRGQQVCQTSRSGTTSCHTVLQAFGILVPLQQTLHAFS